jgi:hypothetical protein
MLRDWVACASLACANPLFFLNLCAENPAVPEAADLLDLLSHEPLRGDPARVEEAWRRVVPERPQPRVTPPRHVFPVYLRWYDEGMIVPLLAEPADEWCVSDAFSTFDFGGRPRTAVAGLMSLLEVVESAWGALRGQPLPLRWRRALAIAIGCPLHFRAIGGRSLQLPLLLAVLRELAATPFSAEHSGAMPFGERAVFATGTVEPDGAFGGVDALERKLAAFVRETPGEHHAVLTSHQVGQLQGTDEGRALLGQLRFRTADSVSALLQMDEFQAGMEALAGPPHPTEIDSLLGTMERLGRSVRFADAAVVSAWLLPHATSDHYRVQLLSNAAMMLLHRGRYLDAEPYVVEIRGMLERPGTQLGDGQRARAAAALASEMFDRADAAGGLALLDRMAEFEPHADAADRARVHGSKCQLYRLAGDWDAAVREGEAAVEFAKAGFASEAGRDINYLIHALLRRAEAIPAGRGADLDHAERLLAKSAGCWAPVDNANARASHFGFCLHYAAELARLRGTPHRPAEAPVWKGPWGHPRLFELLACARNGGNQMPERIAYARALVETATGFRSWGGLFELFFLVYSLYAAALDGAARPEDVAALDDWVEKARSNGVPGWRATLGVALSELRRDQSLDNADALCQAIPYH